MHVQYFRLRSTFDCRSYLLCLLENCKAMKLPQSGVKSILRRDCCLPLIAFIKLEDVEVQDSFSQRLFAVYSLSFLAKFVVKNDARNFGKKNRFQKALNKQKMRQNVLKMHMLREAPFASLIFDFPEVFCFHLLLWCFGAFIVEVASWLW